MQEHANSTSVVCLKCGEPLKDGQRFCPKCGADRETAKNRVCVKCGAQIGDGQTFCTECGAKYLDPDSGIAKAKKVCKKVLIGLLIALGLFIALIVVVLCTGNTHHHQWADATCIAPKTCTECGKTEGVALGHTPGEWEQEAPDYVAAEVRMCQRCTTCGAMLDSKREMLSTLCDNGEFLLTPDEFSKRYGEQLGDIVSGHSTKLVSASRDNLGCCVVKNGKTLIGTVLFYDASENFIADKNVHGIAKLVMGFQSTDEAEIVRAIVPLVMTLDPSLTFDDAKTAAASFFDDPYTCNGLRYAFSSYSGTYYLSIAIV